MSDHENFSIKWNDFQDNIVTSVRDLRKNVDFADVTLACEDDHQIEAHRNILSACSPFFAKLFKRHSHPNPLIYMRGLKAKYLSCILDFIYHGETNVLQDDLDAFLALANEFELKGLMGSTAEDNSVKDAIENVKENHQNEDMNISRTHTIPKKEYVQKIPSNPAETPVRREKRKYTKRPKQNRNAVQPNFQIQEYVEPNFTEPNYEMIETATKIEPPITEEELDTKIDSMMTFADSKLVCAVCGLKTKEKFNMVNHIEGQHIEGVSHPCAGCNNYFRSRGALRHHTSQHHSEIQ
jgi:hypothetical protein